MTPRFTGWVVLVWILLLAGCSKPAPPTVPSSQKVGGMIITLVTNELHTGDNTLVVTLADEHTQASIGNANITATPEMLAPRLPGTPTSGRAQGNGVYNIPVRLAVATRYDIALHIERTGQPATDVSFPIEAAQ